MWPRLVLTLHSSCQSLPSARITDSEVVGACHCDSQLDIFIFLWWSRRSAFNSIGSTAPWDLQHICFLWFGLFLFFYLKRVSFWSSGSLPLSPCTGGKSCKDHNRQTEQLKICENRFSEMINVQGMSVWVAKWITLLAIVLQVCWQGFSHILASLWISQSSKCL